MNFNFDLLEIKTAIEEKRLIFAQKFDKLLQKNFKKFLDFLLNKFFQENFLILISFFIVFVSLLIRSSTDIGYYSAYIIDNFNKPTNFQDNFSPFHHLFFKILIILSIKLAFLLKVNHLIFLDYLINLIGAISIIISYKILKKSGKIPDQITLNLIILSFLISYFWRVNALINNEFINQYSILLALIFIFLSYQISDIEKLNKICQFKASIISFLMVLVDFKFIILVITFEVFRLLKINNFKNIFSWYFLYILSLIFGYLIILATYNYDFFKILKLQINNVSFHRIISNPSIENYALYLNFLIFSYFIVKKNQYFGHFLVLLFVAILIVSQSNNQDIFLTIFYSMAFPAIFLSIFNLKFFDLNFLRKFWFLLITLLILFFSGSEFAEIINFYLSIKLINIFILFLILLIYNYRKLKKFAQNLMIFLISFAFLNHNGMIFRSLFSIRDVNNYQILDYLKSPNSKTDFINLSLKKLLDKESNAIWLNVHLSDIYPLLNYLELSNNSLKPNYDLKNPESTKFSSAFYQNSLNDLINQIVNKNNQLFFSFNSDLCSINLLEFYLRDLKFRNLFIQNFMFHDSFNRLIPANIIQLESVKENLSDHEFEIIKQIKNNNLFFTLSEFEIYVRK